MRDGSRVTAVLGPTNTGKTHLAIERMCAHSSGVIGFPLRLLAREVYERVCAQKGRERVALVTGEERIVPRDARWFLCTAESMPVLSGRPRRPAEGPLRAGRQAGSANENARDFAFAALDEAQLGADAERGHVFTDRLLRVRGREETMILGSEALRPMVRALVPGAEIVERPRFSTLAYAGARKISRLPRRSAIVAFSAEEVYAVAEMLRRLRGGAAVVMGALSPATRNAQVAMFQAGEVDYLVATDAIGMGLNLNVSHVAFAGLHKFDGHRRRRLTVAELAQIAGRAGRHQRDGTFGAVVEDGPEAFLPEEVLAIEEHRFPRLDSLYWRDGEPDLSSVDALIASLSAPPADPVLRAAPQAIDLGVLRRLAEDDGIRDRARGQVARLWAACGIPDFGKVGLDPHARFVARVFGHLADGHLPHRWFADEVARLDRADGDVETIAGRLAHIRTWAYLAQRPDWLADPARWAERTAAVEHRLSDALHAALTQRFVDRRTSVLMRGVGAGAGALPVVIGAGGEVTVEDHPIGRLDGFRFTVVADATTADARLLLATAEKRLQAERARRGAALAGAEDGELTLAPLPLASSGSTAPRAVEPQPGAGATRNWAGGGNALQRSASDCPPLTPPASGRGVLWRDHPVATLAPGALVARPKVALDPALACLEPPARAAVLARLERWVADALAAAAPSLVALAELATDRAASPALRGVARALDAGAGIAARLPIRDGVEALSAGDRQALRRAGVTIGALDLFAPALLRPRAWDWRAALLAAAGRTPARPAEGASVLPRGAAGAELASGFRPLAAQAVRVDLVERVARAAHDARAGRRAFTPDAALATGIGLLPATVARLMAELGFRPAKVADGAAPAWAWRGRPPARREPAPMGGPFAALEALVGRG